VQEPGGGIEHGMNGRAMVVNESDVPLVHWSDPVRGEVGFRTLLGGEETPTGSFTAGVTEMEPGGWLGHHRHEPPEVYYIVHGEGSLMIEGQQLAVSAGSTVFIPGSAEHAIRNTGDEPLRFFYAFAVGSFADIEYRFTAADG
jgi:mannose-6-phosphate isomerase-like protein (cupin superfamily)